MRSRRTVLVMLAMAVLPLSYADQNRIRDYEQSRFLFWTELYPKGGKTLYCGEAFSSRYRRGINIEHVFPMSWVTRELGCGRRKECRLNSPRFNRIEADLHNLFPARQGVNDARGSFRFGILSGEPRRFGGCDFEVDTRRRTAEPAPAARGEIARAMFYMHTEYGLTLFRRTAEMLKKWHRADPPSKHERWRNDRIERIQGTRNPYIDNPDAVRALRF